MDTITIAVEGLATIDAHLANDVLAELHNDGVMLRRPGCGSSIFIPTHELPRPGKKVVSSTALAPLLESAFVGEVTPGGGAVNAALALAKALGKNRRGSVRLLNSGHANPELRASCESQGISLTSLRRQATPVSLIARCQGDRLIIKNAAQGSPGPLDEEQLAAILGACRDSSAVASDSSKDSFSASALFAAAGEGHRYLQPTGSLGHEATCRLLARAECMACNFQEILLLGVRAGFGDPGDLTEDSTAAPTRAATILSAMRRDRMATSQCAVVTLGKYGAIVADWNRNRIHHVALRLNPGDKGVATATGAGDAFFAHWIRFREAQRWPRTVHSGEVLAVVSASRVVASSLGLGEERYNIAVAEVGNSRSVSAAG